VGNNNIIIAHHLHAPAQIIRAANYGIPTLVLIRKPEDAVLSTVIKIPYLSVDIALKDYIRFYSRILPYRQSFVVGLFEEVINDFGKVIRRVNKYFNTDFSEFDHTPENVEKCFIKMNERGKVLYQNDYFKFALPSLKKDQKKNKLRKLLYSKSNAALLEKANSIFETYKKMIEV